MVEQSRDLIREYLTKSRTQPPPIFQTPIVTSKPLELEILNEVNLAYKHPILLMRGTSTDSEYDTTSDYVPSPDEKTKETSFILPVSKKNAFSSLTSMNQRDESTDATPCRLIGKVNPNLIKTWEQLNSSQHNIDKTSLATSESSDKQSCVLFYRKPFNFKEDNCLENKFHVNRVVHSESSGDFYDSIDDRSIIENTYVVDDDIMGSIYHDNDDDETVMVGGEGMAECDSLIEKKKLCWSIENI